MISIHHDYDITALTTFGVAARCARYIEYSDAAVDLPELFRKGIFSGKWMALGGGSNMLFTEPYDGTILHSVESMCRLDGDDEIIESTAGCTLDDVVAQVCALGLWGMENLSGIPGSMGGAAVQNVGAYGVELKDVVDSVTVFDTLTGRFEQFSRDECGYGYRWSIFKHHLLANRFIVAGVRIRVTQAKRPRLDYGNLRSAMAGVADDVLTPSMVRDTIIATRDAKLPQPAFTGSAGSFFKNPVMSVRRYEEICWIAFRERGEEVKVPKYNLVDGSVKVPAAWFIDFCGFKGRTLGGAAVWEKQPLVIVNATGSATATDVCSLMNEIIAAVDHKFGILLKPEVVIV